jgi:hypothetical protein
LGAALAAAGAVGGAVMAGPALAGELAAVANTVAVKIPGACHVSAGALRAAG